VGGTGVGARRLLELHERVGAAKLAAAFEAILDYAERRTRACLQEIPDGSYASRDLLEALEGDLELVLEARVSGPEIVLDFTGSAPAHAGNLNCPEAVTRSACYFALRVLTDPDIPASAGAYRPVRVIVPPGSLLAARRGEDGSAPAVAGGNVETSSRVADLVLAAFGRALGQGTMNNLTLGNDEVVYYETIAGGQGACPDAPGPSAVHVAMSNTLNTPVEALELEFPLRLTEYALRRGSGGRGRFGGGDGVIRELEALVPLHYSHGRRAGPARAQPARRQRPGGQGHRHPGSGAAPPGGDAGRRRIWCPVMRVAFLGLGIMGSRMAASLSRAGFDLAVWNRTRSVAEGFCAEHPGVALAENPADAAADRELVVTMVVDGPQVEHVLLGHDGAATSVPPGTLFVDCSTIGPSATRTIGERLARRGLEMLDAPVTGSAPRAEDGTLTIMVGGTDEAFARAQPVLEAMGRLIVHAGPLGDGQLVKVISNSVAATNAAVVGEALLVAARTGVSLDALVEVMGAGSGGSAMLELKAGPMRQHDFTPLFKLEHMLKDVRLCLEEGQAAGVPFGYAALTREILSAAMGRGLGEQDFAALVEVLEGAAGTRL
jgi:3-hydroxyisobutyrate dehydrogenase-like beta-hydroxyacid dehydrogenase